MSPFGWDLLSLWLIDLFLSTTSTSLPSPLAKPAEIEANFISFSLNSFRHYQEKFLQREISLRAQNSA
jgi:hypothetical protein